MKYSVQTRFLLGSVSNYELQKIVKCGFGEFVLSYGIESE
jgi:hypothetical protein